MKQEESIREDVELVKKIAAGDTEAKRRLYEKYRRPIHFFIKRQIPSKEAGEEICQDIFLAVLEAARREKISEPEKLSSFIYSVSSNKIIDGLRTKQKTKTQEHDMLSQMTGNTEDELISKQKRSRLKQAWQKLNLEAKRMLYLLYVRDWSSEEVGRYFGLSPEVVRKRAQRAKEKIRKEFDTIIKTGHNLFGLVTLIGEGFNRFSVIIVWTI